MKTNLLYCSSPPNCWGSVTCDGSPDPKHLPREPMSFLLPVRTGNWIIVFLGSIFRIKTHNNLKTESLCFLVFKVLESIKSEGVDESKHGR